MTTITFIVTDGATDEARLDTEQEYTLNKKTGVSILNRKYNRTYARSMDGKSGKGTLISSYQTFDIDFIVPLSESAAFDELVRSLADYQPAVLDATDLQHIGQELNFRLDGDSFPKTLVGCSYIKCTLSCIVVE